MKITCVYLQNWIRFSSGYGVGYLKAAPRDYYNWRSVYMSDGGLSDLAVLVVL